eukprot:1797524-Amphidinium_carterae.1
MASAILNYVEQKECQSVTDHTIPLKLNDESTSLTVPGWTRIVSAAVEIDAPSSPLRVAEADAQDIARARFMFQRMAMEMMAKIMEDTSEVPPLPLIVIRQLIDTHMERNPECLTGLGHGVQFRTNYTTCRTVSEYLHDLSNTHHEPTIFLASREQLRLVRPSAYDFGEDMAVVVTHQ